MSKENDMQMDGTGKGQKTVLVVSATESFLASSLAEKLESEGIAATFTHGDINEINSIRNRIELIILFMNEEAENEAQILALLKKVADDFDRKVIIISDEDEKKRALSVIPETTVLEWFERPLVMDDLMKCIRVYMEDSNGEYRKKTVLIVDDDITYMRTVYEWLKEKYHVGMAANGVQAISYLARNNADLVLLDYEMPIANGPQVLEMLRSDSQTGHIPVMFLTGHGDRESVMSVVGLKPADYLLKTIDKPTLLKKLDDFFKKHG